MLTHEHLKSIVDELEILTDEARAYLNPQTGHVITIANEYANLFEVDELDPEEFTGWEQEAAEEARKVLESEDYLLLPSKYEIHEYHIMKDFCLSVDDDRLQEELLNAIHGRGAFRRFKDTAYRHGIEKDWFRFKTEAIQERVTDWLDAEGIAYEQ